MFLRTETASHIFMESLYCCQPPHCSVEQVGKFGPVWLPPFAQDPQLTFLQFSPQPLRCMKTEPAHTWQAGVGQDHPLLRFCDLDILKLMNFEAKVLHENGIRPRLRKSPLNLKQHLRTPTWPVALRLSNVRCFSELRMQVTYLWSLHTVVNHPTALWNK